MSITKLARPEIRRLEAYRAAEQVNDTVRLNANESPDFGVSDGFRRPLNRYPEVRPQQLQDAMAARFGCRKEQLLVTRGTSEAIDLLIRSFCAAGKDNIVLPKPSFSMYKHYADIQGAEVIQVPMTADQDFRIDADRLLAACTESTRVVFVCSPNNPTGTSIPRDDLLRLLDARANRSAIVVDEAYIEFGEQESSISLLAAYPNLIVLRTLSKALGFAGARCGAVVGSADVIAMLSAVQAPYALATPVVECVEDVMQSGRLALAEKAVEEIITERDRLVGMVGRYDFVEKVWPSDANFFLIRVNDATTVMDTCRENNVLLRDFSADLNNCIRITVGSQEENQRLLDVFELIPGKGNVQ